MPLAPRSRPQCDVPMFQHGRTELPGLYTIENTLTHDIYVGSTVCFRKRWKFHQYLLRHGKHHSPHLQASWWKHGEDVFRFMSIAVIHDKDERIRMEQHFITSLRPKYNVSPTAQSCLGVKRSPETRAKIQAAVLEPDRMAKLVERSKQPKSPEHRERIAKAHVGKKHSEETRAKMRASSARRWGKVQE